MRLWVVVINVWMYIDNGLCRFVLSLNAVTALSAVARSLLRRIRQVLMSCFLGPNLWSYLQWTVSTAKLVYVHAGPIDTTHKT
jgi:hypothetical protein